MASVIGGHPVSEAANSVPKETQVAELNQPRRADTLLRRFRHFPAPTVSFRKSPKRS
jgi:hypothetical protein